MESSQQKNIINVLYLFLIASTILSFVPATFAQILSVVLILVTLGAAYAYRSKDSEDGLLYNHMTYLIGTIWIGSAFLLLGIIAAGYWVYANGDHAIIHSAMEQVMAGQILSDAQIMEIAKDYMYANQRILITASLPTIGPAILYFVYRIANGLGRALKGYRIAKPKSLV